MQERGPRGRPTNRDNRDRDKHRVNQQITASEVRLIGVDGKLVGVLSIREALRIAEESGLDLIEMAPDAKPPVCRIQDYGKLRYREQKKAAEARKRSSVQVVKELRLRYSTDKHDLETKIRAARKFLEDGDRVRFQMRFRGREVAYRDLGEQTLRKVVELLSDIGVQDEFGSLMNSRMHITIAPKGKKTAA